MSALKGINLIKDPKISNLEKEWGRYKYLVLEHSPNIYKEIRQLLKDKFTYPVIEFYALIDQALETPVKRGDAVNAAQHIWGYVNDAASDKVKANFERNIQKVSEGSSSKPLKRILWKLVQEKDQPYLQDSLYFIDLF